MKVSLNDLESARSNARGYLASRASPRGFGGPSRFAYVKWAVKRYHNPTEGLDAAMAYLETAYERRKFRESGLPAYFDYLRGYDEAFRSKCAGCAVSKVMADVEIPVAGGSLVSGTIGRLDVTPDGCSIWLFSEKHIDDWQRELRMPLLQAHFAESTGSPIDEVYVGVYSFADQTYESTIYTADRITAATAEASSLMARLEVMERIIRAKRPKKKP